LLPSIQNVSRTSPPAYSADSHSRGSRDTHEPVSLCILAPCGLSFGHDETRVSASSIDQWRGCMQLLPGSRDRRDACVRRLCFYFGKPLPKGMTRMSRARDGQRRALLASRLLNSAQYLATSRSVS
jgi:hypothetical protein